MAVVFNPAIHTKEFLLKSTKDLIRLSNTSSEFAKSELAKDIDILLCKVDGDFIVKRLAKSNPTWWSTDIAQEPNMLKLKLDEQNWTVAHELANWQSGWANSKAASHFDILSVSDTDGYTVAHQLAANQPQWSLTEQAQNRDILKLSNYRKESVAHILARCQVEWSKTLAAKDLELLKNLSDLSGQTVAHYLAQNQPTWALSEEAQNLSILQMADENGNTVAHSLAASKTLWINTPAGSDVRVMKLINKVGFPVSLKIGALNEDWLSKPPAFDKHVLSADFRGKSVAEHLVENYSKRGLFTMENAAYRLIVKGAAFKAVSVVEPSIGKELLNKTFLLVDDALDPLIAVRQACALHSTLIHFRDASISEPTSYRQWSALVFEAENFLRNLVLVHHDVIEDHIFCDINCEQSDLFVNQLNSQINLERNQNLISGTQSAEESSNQRTY
jgi:hypothetical protein